MKKRINKLKTLHNLPIFFSSMLSKTHIYFLLLLLFGLNNISKLVGHFMSSPRQRQKSDRKASRKEREKQRMKEKVKLTIVQKQKKLSQRKGSKRWQRKEKRNSG